LEQLRDKKIKLGGFFNMKKWIEVSMGTVLTLSLLAGCSSKDNTSSATNTPANSATKNSNVTDKGLPIVKDPVAIKIFAPKRFASQNLNDILLWNDYKKLTNVNVEWTDVIREQMVEKRNIVMASGDLPDAFYGNRFSVADLQKYGQQGAFIPLNNLIEKYAPNLKKLMDQDASIKKAITMVDGNIYSVPTLVDPNFKAVKTAQYLWYQKSLLDKLGLSAPKTTDEFYNFLKKVKETEPNLIPLSGGASASNFIPTIEGSWGLADHGMGHPYVDTDPKTNALRFIPAASEYKEMLQYINKLFTEGLLDKDTFSASVDQQIANGIAGKYAVLPGGDPGPVMKQNGYIPGVTLKGPHGDELFSNTISNIFHTGNFVITKNNKNPEATMRWVDYFYSDEGSKLQFMGVENTTYKKLTDGSLDYVDSIKQNPNGLTQDQAVSQYLTWVGVGYPGIIKQEYFKGNEGTQKSLQAVKNVEAQFPKDVWGPFIFTQEETDRMNALKADIETYVKESQAKFITGNLAFTEWDKYVATLQKMGLDDYMKIYKAAYDRYSK
jgi:putative aldouronate transport system substrate-binding protein